MANKIFLKGNAVYKATNKRLQNDIEIADATVSEDGGRIKDIDFSPPSAGVTSYTDLTDKPSIPPPTTDASQLTSGILGDARLSSNVALNLVPTAIKTAAYTAAAKDLVKTDATAGNVPITLPTGLPDKTRIAVKMIAVTGANVTTITLSGTDVFNKSGGVTSATLSLLNQAVTLQYENSTGIWNVISSDAPLSSLYRKDTDVATTTETENAVNIEAWGDSLTDGFGGVSYRLQLSSLSGFNIYNGGISGETSAQIKTRFDARPTTHNYGQIFWVGRNDFNQSLSVTALKSNIAAMVSAIGHDRYLVLGVTTETVDSTATKSAIATYNSDMAALYGSRFIDIDAYLKTQGTGTGQDATDVAANDLPSSLRFDSTHLNDKGYGKVASRIYQSISLIIGSSASKIVTIGTAAKVAGQGKAAIDLQDAGTYKIGGNTVAYVPNQSNFTSSMFLGTGGTKLQHTTSNEGQGNTGVGFNSGTAITTGSNNTSLGTFANNAATTGFNNSAVGYGALQAVIGGSNNTSLGVFAGGSLTTGTGNVAIGASAMQSQTTAVNNIAIGYQSLFTNVTGAGNIAIGTQALNKATSNNNTGIGYFAMSNLTTGSGNTVIGSSAGGAISTQSNNSLFGFNIMPSATGSSNTAFGASSLTQATGASNENTAIGLETVWGAGLKIRNTALGCRALREVTTGNNNVGIGYQAGDNITSGTKNIVIGFDIDAPSATASNQLNIGNVIFGQGLSGAATTKAGTIGIATDALTTAALALSAGTTAIAPLNIAAGTNLTTPVNGTMEYDGTNLYFTVGTTRKTVTLT